MIDSKHGVVDDTSLHNEKYRTVRNSEGCPFKNGAEAFNALSPIPSGPIPLEGNRVLKIVSWCPSADTNSLVTGQIDISMKGYIQTTETLED